MDKSLASALVKAADHAFHPYGNSCGVLVYTGPGQSTVNDCREWAKNSNVATQVVNTRDISTEADISSLVPEADRVILIFDNFDRARSNAQDAVISYMYTASNRCMVIAIANAELAPAVANNFNYKVTIGDRGRELHEAINLESDLLLKLKPLSEAEIFEFMKNLRGGTYFNMGMYSSIKPARAHAATIRIYKVLNMTAVVSGVSYENVGTTKDFRDRTGSAAGQAWYDHVPGYENKIVANKKDLNSKYILWDVKAGSDTWVRYYVVNIATGRVDPISRDGLLTSVFLTDSEKKKLMAKKVEGYDKTTGELIENQTTWRTAKFEHIFWLSQAGSSAREYGAKFMESVNKSSKNRIVEDADFTLFRDGNPNGLDGAELDTLLAGGMAESLGNRLEETISKIVFIDITGSNAYQHELEQAAIRDGYTDKATWAYTKDSFFRDVLEAAKTGVQIVFYTADDDYFNCPELLDMDNVIIKQLDPTELAADDNKFDDMFTRGPAGHNLFTESYRRTVSRGAALNDNPLFVDFD